MSKEATNPFHGSLQLSPEARADYVDIVSPLAKESRQITRTLKQFDALTNEEAATKQLEAEMNSEDDLSAVVSWLDEIDAERLKLGGRSNQAALHTHREGLVSEIKEWVQLVRDDSLQSTANNTAEKSLATTKPRKEIKKTPEQEERRLAFVEFAKNPAQRAGEIGRIKREIRAAKNDHAELTAQLRTARETGNSDGSDRLQFKIKATADKIVDLQNQFIEAGGDKTWRDNVNTLIREANSLKVKQLIEEGRIAPEAAILMGRPQIGFSRDVIAKREPDSPGLPHNDLETLVIFREAGLNAQLTNDLITQAKAKWPQDTSMHLVALATATLLSRRAIGAENLVTPKPLRNTKEVAQGIIRITELLQEYKAGRLPYPSVESFATPSFEQEERLAQFAEVTLIAFLQAELVSSHALDENSVRNLYQKMCNQLRAASRLIGGRKGYEMVQKAIEGLPLAETALITSRLSNKFNYDLGITNPVLTGERRFAEAIRDMTYRLREAFKGNWVKNDMFGEVEATYNFSAVIDGLSDRMEEGDIDLEAIARDLASIDYLDELMDTLYDHSNYEEREILCQFFASTHTLSKYARRFTS